MGRQARVVFPGVPHHVTQRGNYRQDVFFEAGDRIQYLTWLTEYAKKYGLEVWAYCLMTNHIHLIAFPRQQDSLARTLATTHTWKIGTDTFFQGHNRSHPELGS